MISARIERLAVSCGNREEEPTPAGGAGNGAAEATCSKGSKEVEELTR